MGQESRHSGSTSRLAAGAAVFGGLLAGAALANTIVVRPGPCTSPEVYLLAGNSGALIRLEPGQGEAPGDHVIVYRQDEQSGGSARRKEVRGWASRRLLDRFDLRIGQDDVLIVNSGAFCTTEE